MTPYSKLRILPRVDLVAEAPLAKPLVIYCEVTNRCNLACKFCPESHPQYAEIVGGMRSMSIDDMQLVRDRIAEAGGIRTLYFHSLGEPMINPNTPAFIAMLRPIVERMCLTTNGTVPMTKLLACPPDYIRISVYGLNQREFEENTQSVIDHRRVKENLRAIWEARNKAKQELPYLYVKSNGKFSVLHHAFKDMCDEVDVEPTMNWNGEHDWGGKGTPNKVACPAPFYTMTIHSDMRVSLCGVDWSKKLIVGNLREQSITDIWGDLAAEELRKAHLRGDRCSIDGCSRCTYLFTTLPDNVDALSVEEYESRCQKREMAGT